MGLAKRVADAIFEKVNPVLGTTGILSEGGRDTHFILDEVAERALEKVLEGEKVAYFSEERGLTKMCKDPKYLLIVDPIDGTRPALCNFEQATTSVALCDYNEKATLGDIREAVVKELKSGAEFMAERGKGFRSRLSKTNEIRKMRWSFEVVGYPVREIMKKIAPLIDQSSQTGAVFVFSSTCFSITRLLTGQLDAYVDVRKMLMDKEGKKGFGMSTYDIAAADLLAKESGVVITDAYGKSLDKIPLLSEEKLSCVAASNRELHRKIIEALN